MMKSFKHLSFLFLMTFGLVVGASDARAQCYNPPGNEGEQVFNTDSSVMQFCNGSLWVNMSRFENGSGGGDNLGDHKAIRDLNMSGKRIMTLGVPVTPNDIVTKGYVDALTGVDNENDPQIGEIVAGKWCVSDGTLVNCNQMVESPPAMIVVVDNKTEGTAGGTAVTNAWSDRTLNKTILNNLPGASLSANSITLPAGTYYIDAAVPFENAFNRGTRLFNASSSTALVYGSNTTDTFSYIRGTFVLGAAATLRIQYYSSLSGGTTDLGAHNSGAALGMSETFTSVSIRQVAPGVTTPPDTATYCASTFTSSQTCTGKTTPASVLFKHTSGFSVADCGTACEEVGATCCTRTTAGACTATMTAMAAGAASESAAICTADECPWTPQTVNRNWADIASSADGVKLVAPVVSGQIYTSTDSGVTWVPRDSNRAWSSVASSADGVKLVATVYGGRIYTSIDSGLNWTQRDSNRNWALVASSNDGVKLVSAVYGGRIYTSTNSGVNWTQRDSANRNWGALASSADGTKLVGAVFGGQIYTSVNSGVTWTARNSNRNWAGASSSADGSTLLIGTSPGFLYTSTDSGVNWVQRADSRNWISTAMSADGTIMAAADQNGRMYVSKDSGENWVAAATTQNWQQMASSADGNKMSAIVNGGQIHTSQCPIPPPSGGNELVYNTPGPFSFVVPDYASLTIEGWGAGAGGQGGYNPAFGGNGGATTIPSLTLNAGGGRGNGTGGTATGGTINTAGGNTGIDLLNCGDMGYGGSSPNGGARACGPHVWGNPPGGGGAGAPDTEIPGSGGGGGSYLSKTYTPGELTVGATISGTIGAGGVGSTGAFGPGGNGADGQARVTWTPAVAAAPCEHIDTWQNLTLANRYWYDAAVSTDGQHIMLAAAGEENDMVYTSTNGGSTWANDFCGMTCLYPKAAMSGSGAEKLYQSSVSTGITDLDISIDGTTMIMWNASLIMGGINTSFPTGGTWSVAMNSDGSRLAAALNNGAIYVYDESTGAWSGALTPSRQWVSIDSSADGVILIAATANDGIYVSTDSGATWEQKRGGTGYSRVSMSDNGSVMAAGQNGQPILVSTDGGTTWEISNSSGSAVASTLEVSGDGTTIVSGRSSGAPMGWGMVVAQKSSCP